VMMVTTTVIAIGTAAIAAEKVDKSHNFSTAIKRMDANVLIQITIQTPSVRDLVETFSTKATASVTTVTITAVANMMAAIAAARAERLLNMHSANHAHA